MVTVYADINCPFCYALHEWLAELGLLEKVDWNLVDHSPRASYASYSIQELTDLTQEVFTIKHRAPDIAISLPKARSNVRVAAKYIYAVRDICPEKVIELRRQIYRAYWLHGENIESKTLIERIGQKLGIPSVDLDNPEFDGQVELATKAWRSGPFESRLPAMRRDVELPLCGLPSKKDCVGYVLEGLEAGQDYTDHSCAYEPKPIIVAMGDWAKFWQLGDLLKDDVDIIYVGMMESLKEQCSAGLVPDMLVVAETVEHSLISEFSDLKGLLPEVTSLIALAEADLVALSDGVYDVHCDAIFGFDLDRMVVAQKIRQHLSRNEAR